MDEPKKVFLVSIIGDNIYEISGTEMQLGNDMHETLKIWDGDDDLVFASKRWDWAGEKPGINRPK